MTAGYLLYQVAEKFFDSHICAAGTWLVYVLFIGLSPWMRIPYSDSIGLIFPVLILWMYQKMDNEKKKYLKYIMIAVVSFLGYKIKPTVIIVNHW